MNRRLTFIAMLTLAFILVTSQFSFAKDQIEGKWYNEEKTAKVEIYLAKNGKYYGKIVWLKEPEKNGNPKTDENNPKESERSKPLMGLLLLKSFVKDGNAYEDGSIYDPKNGKTYSCKITYKNANTLSIRGYIGISLIGRTTTWTKAE